MRPKGSTDRLSYRRPWTAALLDEDQGISSVYRWKAMKVHAGAAELKTKPHPGRGCWLSAQDKDLLKSLLIQSPGWLGYRAVDLSAGSARDLPKRLGILSPRLWGSSIGYWVFRISLPSTGRGNRMRRPGAHGVWWSGREAKKARHQTATIVLMDPSGFMLQPTRRRASALSRHCPYIRCGADTSSCRLKPPLPCRPTTAVGGVFPKAPRSTHHRMVTRLCTRIESGMHNLTCKVFLYICRTQ